MPLYEYRCMDCDESFEKLVRSSATEESEVRCPSCGSNLVKRLVSMCGSFGFSSGSGGGCGPAVGGG